jgi:hypothetical protein
MKKNKNDFLFKRNKKKNLFLLIIFIPLLIVCFYFFLISFEDFANKTNFLNFILFLIRFGIILVLFKEIRKKIIPSYYPNMRIVKDYVNYKKIKKLISEENFKTFFVDTISLWYSKHYIYIDKKSLFIKTSDIFLSKHIIQSLVITKSQNSTLYKIIITTYNNKIFKLGDFSEKDSKKLIKLFKNEVKDIIIDDAFTNILITNRLFVTDTFDWFHKYNKKEKDFVNNIFNFDKKDMPNYLDYK